MPTAQEIETKFWKSLRSDRTMMVGLNGVADGHTRPMTAQIDGDADRAPIWFFGASDTALVRALTKGDRVIATFAAKDHDLFATIHGSLTIDNDRAVIDRLWNRFAAAWYEGGKDDPRLVLLRFDTETAEIWLEGSSLVAGLRMLFGADPKESYKDNIAKVSLA